MTSNATGALIFLTLFGIVTSSSDGGVDCRKFVFAPLCRGVAAKRDHSSLGHYKPDVFTNEESNKHLLGPFRAAIEMLQDAENSQQTRPQFKTDSLIKIFQQEQTNHFLKSLFGKRRGNSEMDNFPAQDFDNL